MAESTEPAVRKSIVAAYDNAEYVDISQAVPKIARISCPAIHATSETPDIKVNRDQFGHTRGHRELRVLLATTRYMLACLNGNFENLAAIADAREAAYPHPPAYTEETMRDISCMTREMMTSCWFLIRDLERFPGVLRNE